MKKTIRGHIGAFLATLGLMLSMMLVATPAQATTGTDDYPSSLKSAAQDAVTDPWGFYNRECVSFVAWRLNNDNGFTFSNNMNGGHFGSAIDWKQNAINLFGASVFNTTPAAGSVAWWDAGYHGVSSFGHVAYVDSVNSDGSITIEQYNTASNPGGYSEVTLASGSGSWPSGFLHFKDQPLVSQGFKPSVVQYGSEMDVFVRGGDGQIYKDTWNGSVWSGFNSLGGNMASNPVAIAFGTELSVFARGADGYIYKNTWNGTSWSGFNSLGGTFVGSPSVVQYGSEMDVFVRGGDNQVYKNTWNGTSWSGFNSLGGNVASDPFGVQYGSELTVFGRGVGGDMLKNTWNGTSWSGFGSMGGAAFQGNPQAIQYNSEFIVFANSGGNIFKKSWNGSSWGGWDGLGAGATDPFGVQYGSEMDVFVRGGNGQIYKQTWSGSSWSGFSSLGGNMSGDPTAISYNGELSVFAIGTDGHIYKNTWNGSSWSGFNYLG